MPSCGESAWADHTNPCHNLPVAGTLVHLQDLGFREVQQGKACRILLPAHAGRVQQNSWRTPILEPDQQSSELIPAHSSAGQGEPPNEATLLPLLLLSYKMYWNLADEPVRRDKTRLRAAKNVHSVDRLFFPSLIKYWSTFTYTSIMKIIVPKCKQVGLKYNVSSEQEWNKRRLPSHS